MQEQYGEYEIRYDETREKFEAFKGEERTASSGKLSDLKKRLDRVNVVRAKFNKFKILQVTAGGRYDDKTPRIIESGITYLTPSTEMRNRPLTINK